MSTQPMAKASPPGPWSDIPLDLAVLVLRRLPADADHIRFSAVCSHWRTAAREFRLPPPLLVLPGGGTAYSLSSEEPSPLPRSAGYTDACGNWLVFWSEEEDRRPLLPGTNDLGIHKLIFCSPDLVAALVSSRRCTRIAVCQPGPSSWWTVRVAHDWLPQYVDIIFHGEKLYALDHVEGGALYSMEISTDNGATGDPWISEIRRVIHGNNGVLPRGGGGDGYSKYAGCTLDMKTMYLVESSRGDLLMVVSTACGRVRSVRRGKVGSVDLDGRYMFKVFRADFEQSRWTEVTTLGGNQVLFLRRRCCRSVCASHVDMPGDCIVFMENDDEDHDWYGEESSSSCGVYNMKCGSVSTFLPIAPWKRDTTVFATWLFPKD
ncbi:hypothetical protein QOZ80_9AG0688450 [Eleusine coracana subsp. coracana]|nr:hypothetical protein QOZ80_9AG0688450 [Eleusine coracana subsp. coracana]